MFWNFWNYCIIENFITLFIFYVGADGRRHRYCLVQYFFKEWKCIKSYHGNIKTRRRKRVYIPYLRTWQSTKQVIMEKTNATCTNPREEIYKTVHNDLGGIQGCSHLGQLPRDRRQVNGVRYFKSWSEAITIGVIPSNNFYFFSISDVYPGRYILLSEHSAFTNSLVLFCTGKGSIKIWLRSQETVEEDPLREHERWRPLLPSARGEQKAGRK